VHPDRSTVAIAAFGGKMTTAKHVTVRRDRSAPDRRRVSKLFGFLGVFV